MATRLNFHCPVELLTQIKARGEISDSIRNGLTRYYALLTESRKQIKSVFSVDEFIYITAQLHEVGGLDDSVSLHQQISEIPRLKQVKPGPEDLRPVVLDKLGKFTTAQSMAFTDCLERVLLGLFHWNGGRTSTDASRVAKLVYVDLRVGAPTSEQSASS